MYITLRDTPGGQAEAAPRPSGTGRRVAPTVFALGTVSLLTDISSESVAAVLPLYITVVVGLGPLAFGFIDGVYQGISAVVRISGGRIADRTDRPKWVAVAGYGVSAVSRVGLLFVSGFWAITSVVGLDRIGKGLRTGPRDALIATAAPPEFLGRNFGVHRAMDTAGALIGPLLAFGLLAMFPVGLAGYDAVFMVSFATAVIGVAVLVIIVPDLRRARTPEARAVRPRWSDLGRPEMRRLLVAAGVLSLATVGDGFLYLVLQERSDFDATLFPLLFVGTSVAYLALAIPFGRLADRVGRTRVFVGGYLLLLGTYALAGFGVSGIAGVLAVLVLLGAFYAATDGVLAAIASRLVPEASRASGISAAQTVVALARFGASVGFGLVWQFAGMQVALAAFAAALVVAIVIAAILLLRVRRDREVVAS